MAFSPKRFALGTLAGAERLLSRKVRQEIFDNQLNLQKVFDALVFVAIKSVTVGS